MENSKSDNFIILSNSHSHFRLLKTPSGLACLLVIKSSYNLQMARTGIRGGDHILFGADPVGSALASASA